MPALPSDMPHLVLIGPVFVIEHSLRALDEHAEAGPGHAPEHFDVARGFNNENALVVEVRDRFVQPNDETLFHGPPLGMVRLAAAAADWLECAPIGNRCLTEVTNLCSDTRAGVRDAPHPANDNTDWRVAA